MAFPFGGHPTLAAYMHWAREQGFRAQSIAASDERGKTHTAIKLSKEGGRSVVVVGVKQHEHLAPSMVGYLDRRLGVKSPWISVDTPDLDPKGVE